MRSKKIAITIDPDVLAKLDRLVGDERFPSRSSAIQEAVAEKLSRMDRNRLARECAKLDPKFEQELAEEGLAADFKAWPDY